MRFASKIKSLKKEILGKEYLLSLAFVKEKKSQEINKKYRKKDKATNVLSFSLKKNMGELVLCEPIIKEEAKQNGKTFSEWLQFLVIHGMLHLKGMRHGSIMTKAEKAYDQKYNSRNRRGVLRHSGSRRRIQQRRKKS
ncbi:MAG TPA: rRNA maturation RNase YbeY [Candidatus Paceibacterota bacterium]|jgi:probable rRNA maturation factor|nr:rRNA maturation RNase YbeY [Candidatus Paceibacterota bacterium]